jgi:hypothetical protein
MPGPYGERSEEEKAMPDWQRDALDRQRAAEQADMNTHPALWAKLIEINGKLDELLKILRDGKP